MFEAETSGNREARGLHAVSQFPEECVSEREREFTSETRQSCAVQCIAQAASESRDKRQGGANPSTFLESTLEMATIPRRSNTVVTA